MVNIPVDVEAIGGYYTGCYSDVVEIVYHMFYAKVIIDLKLPQKEKIERLTLERKDVLNELKSQHSEELQTKQTLIKQDILREIHIALDFSLDTRSLIMETGKKVLAMHMELLTSYGDIISYNVDTIHFVPNEESVGLLEANNYFCNTVPYPYIAFVEWKYEWMSIYGHRNYSARVVHSFPRNRTCGPIDDMTRNMIDGLCDGTLTVENVDMILKVSAEGMC